MELLEIKTFEDALAYVSERTRVSPLDLYVITMKFGFEAEEKIEALIAERGIEVVGEDAC